MKFRFKFITVLAAAALLASCGDKDNDPKPKPDEPVNPTPKPTDILDVPDKDGFNIKGVVYEGETPISGVSVSDGVSVATTDEYGRYYLNTDKTRKHVFVSLPSGYSADCDKIYPKFYSTFKATDRNVVEQHNFKLNKNEKKDYVVIAIADMHIANVRQTPEQFTNKFLPDLNETIDSYKMQGKDVYVITLGDESHDLYWYSKNLALGATKPYLEKIHAPLFNCMGNHDNDPYCADDFLAENVWRNEMGPTYYSFNIGDIHYVVLDNIRYTNKGGAQGTIGDREYDKSLTAEQYDWLSKDLAKVSKSTPVVVCMHAPYFEKAKLYNGSQTPRNRYALDDEKALSKCFTGFTDVTILSGHAHLNSVSAEDNIREYNIGGANGSLWYTGQSHMAGNHICRDGSVGGYFVMEVSGKTFQTYYKSMGYDRNYQFRSYDINHSFIKKTKFYPNSKRSNPDVIALFNEKASDASTGYGCMDEYCGVVIDGKRVERTDNMVFINVFNFDDRWKIEVTENGKALTVTRFNAYDPLHIASLACKLLDNGEKSANEESITTGRLPALTSHMFQVKASSAASTLNIKVTDPYGKIYTEEMKRPKQLELDMR